MVKTLLGSNLVQHPQVPVRRELQVVGLPDRGREVVKPVHGFWNHRRGPARGDGLGGDRRIGGEGGAGQKRCGRGCQQPAARQVVQHRVPLLLLWLWREIMRAIGAQGKAAPPGARKSVAFMQRCDRRKIDCATNVCFHGGAALGFLQAFGSQSATVEEKRQKSTSYLRRAARPRGLDGEQSIRRGKPVNWMPPLGGIFFTPHPSCRSAAYGMLLFSRGVP